MAHIVILGAGIGGMPCAIEMRDMLPKEHRITVVNALDYFQFVPSNPWLAVGWRTREEVIMPVRPMLARKGVGFIAKAATKIDAERSRLELEGGDVLDYDYLVITTGPKLSFDEVPGAGPHGGHTHSVCAVGHAEMFWADYQEFLKNPGPVVVGAMPGASCFGPAYEFAFILETALRRRKVRDRVPMTFVTPEPYIGHLGLDGVGDTKSLLESALREKHIKWITNAKVTKVEPGVMLVDEVNEDGSTKAKHELPFAYSMMLPAFRGVEAVRGVEGLCNPRGFILADKHQRNPAYPNIFSIGVCVAIPPVAKTPLPVGVPKTGFMIESMVTATAQNVSALIRGEQPKAVASWNAVCLADFGDSGIAFVAQPQIPPRNVNWSASGKWVHAAKIGFERYFLRKIRQGKSETFYEKLALDMLGITKLKEIHEEVA